MGIEKFCISREFIFANCLLRKYFVWINLLKQVFSVVWLYCILKSVKQRHMPTKWCFCIFFFVISLRKIWKFGYLVFFARINFREIVQNLRKLLPVIVISSKVKWLKKLKLLNLKDKVKKKNKKKSSFMIYTDLKVFQYQKIIESKIQMCLIRINIKIMLLTV